MSGVLRGTFALLLGAALLGAAFARPPAARAAGEACFTETGFCVRGDFLAYWQARGGLAINGYPLSDARIETLEDGRDYTVQYFERVRMEYHPENAEAYRVLLGQFGRAIHPADPPVPPPAGPITQDGFYFTETGHYVPGRFFGYWNQHGGLAQFGFPLSEVITETLEDNRQYSVQYFERARFELHPENQPPYDVLLGQFGRRILAQATPLNAPDCAAGNLAVASERDAGAGSRFATIYLTNTGSQTCALRGTPQVQLLDAAGNPLAVTVRYDNEEAVAVVALPPSEMASFGLRWSNWCGADPGQARVRVTLPDNGGTFTAAAPDTPPCLGAGQGSTLGVTPFTNTGPAGHANVVLRYYKAINARDYRAAYALLGAALRAGQSYDSFAAGYATTTRVAVLIGAISGANGPETNRVAVILTARQANGGEQRFTGTYDVGAEGGALLITGANIAPGT